MTETTVTTETPETIEGLQAKFDAEKKRLNDEAAQSRREKKDANKAVDHLQAQLKSINEALEVDDEHPFDVRISELRAAVDSKSKSGSELAQLQSKLTQLERDSKKYKTDFEAAAKERDEISIIYRENVITTELYKSFDGFGVKPELREPLESFLRAKGSVKLNDKRKPVWVMRDEDGDEVGETSIKDGLNVFLEKNAHYLPPAGSTGSGQTASAGRPEPARKGNLDTMLGLTRDTAHPGLIHVDRVTFAKNKDAALGIK